MSKIQLWLGEIKKMGLVRFTKEKYFNWVYKNKFKQTGVSYPDLSKNVSDTIAASANKDSKMNQATSYYSLHKAFNNLPLQKSEISMIDIGCGAGRVLNFGMLLHFKAVAGVELDGPSVEKAKKNCIKMQEAGYNTPFNLYQDDASKFQIPEGVNTFYFFNPFGEKTMEDVLANIMRYAEAKNKTVFIVYTEATVRQVFDRHPKLTLVYESLFRINNLADVVIYKTA